MTGQQSPPTIPTLLRLELQQLITRTYLPNLTPTEFVVLSYIFDRTIMWGRVSQRISIREFEIGNRTNGGVPLARRSIVSALGSLKAKGVIVAVGNRRSGHSYSIDFGWSGAHVARAVSDAAPQTDVN